MKTKVYCGDCKHYNYEYTGNLKAGIRGEWISECDVVIRQKNTPIGVEDVYAQCHIANKKNHCKHYELKGKRSFLCYLFPPFAPG
jgi:hypothetical protein